MPVRPDYRGNALNDIRAITLDLDDTLWEIAPVIRRAEDALWCWLADHCPEIPRRHTRESALALREQIVQQHADRSHDLRFLRRAVLARMATDSGYSEDIVEPAFRVFDTARNTVELFPEVVPALESLSRRFTLVALTNGNADLDVIGIRRLFAGVVTAAEAGAAKPAAAIFERAVAVAGVEPEQTVHVGDHPEIDMAGAADAGLFTVWINRAGAEWPEHLRRPHAEIVSVGELQRVLDGWQTAKGLRRAT